MSKRYRWLLSVIILLLLAALFLTYARGAWLALLTGSLAAWLIRRKWMTLSFLLVAIGCILGILWLRSGDRYLRYAPDYRTTIFHTDFREHLLATYEMKDISTAERLNRWVAAAQMAGEKPLTGFGPAAFYFSYKPYQSPAFRTWVSDNPEHSTVHNYFLLVLTEQGFPGLLLFLLLATLLLFYAERLYHRLTDRFYRVTILTTGSVLVMILTLNMLSDLIETDKIGSLFLLCMALLVAVDVRQRGTLSGSGPDVQGIP
jgi:O-antigen ligase